MKRFAKILWLISVCTFGVSAQQIIRQYVEAPRDIMLPLIAVQPNCPVQFENVRYLVPVKGGGGSSYRIRNISKKPIRGITIAGSYGMENTYYNNGDVLIKPGQLMSESTPICPNCVKEEIVSLTDELREKLNLKTPMQGIFLLMVVEVEFMDGTKYSDEKTYNAMTEYIDKLADALELQKQQTVKKP